MVAEQTRTGFWDALVDFYKIKNPEMPGTVGTPEPTIIFAGSENAGKTTLLTSFIYKSRPNDIKPTIGLDYKYIRTNSSTDNQTRARTVHHFWEIGGGRQMSSTLGALLTDTTTVMVIIDVSRRSTATSSGRVQPQIAIICNKYDLLPAGVNVDLMFRTIRMMSVSYDASVLCHAVDHRGMHQQFRNGISRLLTQRPFLAGPIQMDSSKPIAIPVSTDSIESIGLPPGLGSSPDPLRSWSRAFEDVFGAESPSKSTPEAELEPEPLIDTAIGPALETRL